MSNFFSRGKQLILWGLILLALGSALYQMLVPPMPADDARPTATPLYTAQSAAMPQATARPTATAKSTAKPTTTPKPTAHATATVKSTAQPTAVTQAASADTPISAASDSSAYSVEIRYAARCDDYNHVGSAWSQAFYVDGEEVHGRVTRNLAPGETFTLETVITDQDNSPDIGRDQRTVALTAEQLTNGTSITATVEVRENRGRYSGNVAVWTVVYTVTPIQ